MKHIEHNELLARYFSGEATAQERNEVEVWQQASVENQRLFAEFKKIWQNAAERPLQIPDIDAAWKELTAQLGLASANPRARIPEALSPPQLAAQKSLRSDRYIWAAAATILLAFATILYQFLFNANSLHRISAAYGQRKSIELPDGSLAMLNSGSAIQFYKNFSDSLREVVLSGEGYFEIKPGQRPFLVRTPNAQIRVLGTKFGVWARSEQTRVTVREGRVSLGSLQTRQAPAVVLTANQMSVCSKTDAPEPPQSINANHALGWLEGRIIFDQTALIEVIDELERVYNVPVELSNPALGQMTITGSFHHKPVEAVLASISLTLNLQYRKEKDKYVIWQQQNQ